MSKLIAMVATAVFKDGVRTVIQPGQELPELSAHDVRSLKASGAAEDANEKAAMDLAAEQAALEAGADFSAAVLRVQQEQASTVAEPGALESARPMSKAGARK